VLVLLTTAVLRDTMNVETWGFFLHIHGYQVLYIATFMGVLLTRAGQLGQFMPRTATDWGMFGFLLVLLVSALINGVDIIGHKYIDLFFKAVVLYFLLSRLADTPRRVTLVAVAVIVATSFLAFEAWRKYRSGLLYYARPYYISSFHEFGLQLVVTLPLLGAMLSRRMNVVFRALLFILIPLYVLVALRTHSRSAYLGIGFGLVLLAWHYRRRWYLQILALPIVLYAVVHQPGRVEMRLESIWTHKTEAGTEDTSIDMRLEQMRTAMRIIQSHPILGIGPRQFLTEYEKYVSAEDAKGWSYTMHSVPLLILSEEGFIGFAIFYGLLVLGALRECAQLRSKARDNPEIRPTAIVASGAFMAFLSWMAYSLTQPAAWTINIYATVGLVAACLNVANTQLADLEGAAETDGVEQTSELAFPPPAATEVAFS